MPKTTLADIIVPSIFAPYAVERTTALSEIIASGIAERAPEFDARASGGGKTVDMPYWKEITGVSQVLSDSASMTLNKISAGQDTASIHNRGNAWGVNDLADFISGDDPAGQIASMIGGFWARDMQDVLLAVLAGLFDNTTGVLRTSHRLNIYSDVVAGSITDSNRLLGDTFITGLNKLGDASPKITAVAMHSDVEALLRTRDLIDDLPDSTGKVQLTIFQGRRVIVDDSCPRVAGTNSPAYTTYMFGQGAFAWGEGTIEADKAIETNRDTLASDDLLASRRRFILHPRGVRWIGAPAGGSPTNVELSTGVNWSKVYLDKNIRVVAVRHNV